MNYTALIENRKSVRQFRDKAVPAIAVTEIQEFYAKECHRLVPEIATELVVLGTEAREALEGTAGYQEFLVGAPRYLVLLSEEHKHAGENAGYMMEDMILKLTDMGYDSCWLTFTDADKVTAALKLDSKMKVAAIAAFGYGEKTAKKLRLNILSMSRVDVEAQRGYYSHKKDINELVFVNEYGCSDGLNDLMGFYEDMLWQAFYAVAQTPSYLNRQPYAFVVKDKNLILVKLADDYTDEASAALNLGIAMLHFDTVASQWVGQVKWDLKPTSVKLPLPAGASVAAVCHM